MSKPRQSVRRCGAVLIAAAALILTGCADSSEAADEADLTLRLVIPDGNIREPGATCSGARAFRFAHPQTPYVIQDADGTEVASGTLPDGVAETTLDEDLGDIRQPTVCVMTLEIPGVESLEGHSLVIDDRSPSPIAINPDLEDTVEVVLQ
jgi:hypothetical protein